MVRGKPISRLRRFVRPRFACDPVVLAFQDAVSFEDGVGSTIECDAASVASSRVGAGSGVSDLVAGRYSAGGTDVICAIADPAPSASIQNIDKNRPKIATPWAPCDSKAKYRIRIR